MEASEQKKNRKVGKITKEEYEEGSRLYFESIKELPTLYIEAVKVAKPYVYLDVRNLIVLLIYKSYHLEKWIKLQIVRIRELGQESVQLSTRYVTLKFKTCIVDNDCTEFITDDTLSKGCEAKFDSTDIFKESRRHPSITLRDKKLVISGVSSVLRFIFKHICYKIEESTDNNLSDRETLAKLKQFLGFRTGCLQTCAEGSIWTKFCEVDMVSSVNEISKLLEIVDCTANVENITKVEVPGNLQRFEYHLCLPVKTHNFQRAVQDVRKANQIKNKSVNELAHAFEKNVSIRELKHEFAEGTTLLLSDLILFPSFNIFVKFLGRDTFEQLFPRVLEWHDKVHEQLPDRVEIEIFNLKSYCNEKISWSIPNVAVESLYLRDTSRYKPSLRQFTRQYEVEEALENLRSLNISPLEVQEEDPNFQWKDIPLLAHPEGGNLPRSRQQRKCDQLASMAYYALKVYSVKRHRYNQINSRRFRIVDFCSGGGHVGILLAWLLPECDVVLVENKDESLRRAQERISGLGLSNVFCYQSNLDYFESEFDLGMALHACGTATDLVISKCVKVNASFVCCPCCYGAVQENHILTYPRSTIFQKVSLRHYLVICHASDQTQAEEKTIQGKHCMALIDTDRCLYAAENQYDVKLCKIVPDSASPKNHILVAISSI